MLGVRLKTWVKTHLGRERNQSQRTTGSAAPFTTKPSLLATSRSAFEYHRGSSSGGGQSSMNINTNVDKSTSSSISNSTSGGVGGGTGLPPHGLTLLSSPDTGYSTDGLGLSNSNLLNHVSTDIVAANNSANSPSSINTTAASTPLSLHQYATAKKREWFLQNNTSSSSSVNPSNFQFAPAPGKGPAATVPIKPTRIQTNPWYNPKSKRLSSSSSTNTDSSITHDNHHRHGHGHGKAEQVQQHTRHSTCTTITADSGEGSFDSSQSQKSSPRVSFSSSSLESYKPDKVSTNSRKKSGHDCSRVEDESSRIIVVGNNSNNTKSPYRGWYQPPPPATSILPALPDNDSATLLSSKLSSFTPYFVNTDGLNGGAAAAAITGGAIARRKQETGKRNSPFGFLKKLFRKGSSSGSSSSKKGRNSNIIGINNSNGGGGGDASAAEVSLHDLYYHQNPIPTMPAGSIGVGGGTGTTSSMASPYFFTELQQLPPPAVPPRISSFLTPTPNAFRRRTVSDASTSMVRRNLTPNLGYTYREPVPVPVQHQQHQRQQFVTRTPVLLSRQCRVDKIENAVHAVNQGRGHGHDLEYDDKYKIHNAYNSNTTGFGVGPKLSSVYCTPSRQHNGYASYYSSPPPSQSSHGHGHGIGIHFENRSNLPATTAAAVLHTNSPIFQHQEVFATSTTTAAVNQTPSRQPSHIVNRKLILQSPTPFTNNSSYSPIHRVAVLKGNHTTTNPSINNHSHKTVAVAERAELLALARTGGGRPEYFSPQQNHSSKYLHHHRAAAVTSSEFESYNNNGNGSHSHCHYPMATTFFSPQLQPSAAAVTRGNHNNHNDPRRRCFQYISSSNQNSPILNTHRQQQANVASSKSGHQQQQQQQAQLLFNRLSPILRAPAAFSNHHRVYPIKNYSPMTLGMGTSTSSNSKLVQDPYVLLSSSSGSSSSTTRSPAMNVRTHTHSRTSPAAVGCSNNIDKIYEEIDDAEEEEDDANNAEDNEDEEEEEDALTTTAATVADAEDDDLSSTHPTIEEDTHKLQQYSDDGDGQGGDYYQFDYDSSLLSTTEELDETSHSHSHSNSQDQPSNANAVASAAASSTSTILKAGTVASDQLQAFSPYAVIDKQHHQQHQHRPLLPSSIAAAATVTASVDISPTTRQLLEIENDLRFCRLIAEAQTLLRELESTTTSTLVRNGLEPFHQSQVHGQQQQHQHQQWRFGQQHGSSTSLRGTTNTTGRQQSHSSSFTSNNGSNNTYRRNQRSSGLSSSSSSSAFGVGDSRVEECPQSDPLRRKAYECWALRRLQQELAGCCASPLAFRHNFVPYPRQQFLQQMQMQNTNPSVSSTRRPQQSQLQANVHDATNL